MTKLKKPSAAAYDLSIAEVFRVGYSPGAEEFYFSAADYRKICASAAVKKANGGEAIRNPPDVLYSFRSRKKLPEAITRTAPPDREWVIELAGKGADKDSRYRFRLVKRASNRILPREDLRSVRIPNATPEIIAMYALSDEQALLALVRYNRLIDIFLGITTYSLQNHLKTNVQGVGQIEIDEVYVGLDKLGRHYIVPVQAKGGKDQIHGGQLRQDIAFCQKKFPDLECRAIAAQFMSEDRIALFELALEGDDVKVVEEKHYKLVPRDQIERAGAAR